MKTVIIIMVIYFVMQLLRRAAQGQQQPRQDLPEYHGSSEDVPLSGPWDNSSSRERPVEAKTESGWESEFEPDPQPAYEPGPVGGKRQQPKPEARPRDRAAVEQVRIPESCRSIDLGTPGECEAVSPQGRKAAAMQAPCRRRRRKGRVNPLTAVLDSQSTLVGSMVLGQVLGIRGGLAGERKKQPLKKF
ncbi:MAG: hypothetical protein WCY82_01080 [Desulfotomaculaceae bacterium]